MALVAVGGLLAGVLYGIGVPGTLAPWLGWTFVASIAGGIAFLVAGAIRSASTTMLIVVGAVLQAFGGGSLVVGPRMATRSVPFLAVLLISAIGFWLLLTGVIGAGVRLGTRERDDSRS
jgi:hypothetical protein